MNILVTGGCGYVGSSLVPELLKRGHSVSVIDTQWFGNTLVESQKLTVIKGDIRDPNIYPKGDFSAVIHLANIANDPSVELNPELSWEVNVLATYQLLHWSKKSLVKDFIYASSGSVYGLSEAEKVTEDLDLVPISTYNKTKMIAEQVVLNWSSNFRTVCLRPATICGFSPRMRFDLAVNLLTFQALSKKEITILGGSQVRPNIHIKDMVSTYLHFIEHQNLPGGIYNAGFENLTIAEIAETICNKIPSKVLTKPSNDPRSYRLDSSKLLATGFTPNFDISGAIEDLRDRYHRGELVNEVQNNTVAQMKLLGLGSIAL
jgi:nucleoside-diphosphate-sugar epimerase